MRIFTRIAQVAFIAVLATGATGCDLDEIHDAIYGDYHRLSPATVGVYLTIKRHATDTMIAAFDHCRSEDPRRSEATCGTETLRAARQVVEPELRGRALEVWNGEYSVFGWHPDLGKGFRDEEGGDFATAVNDLRSRNHECLRVHWKTTGTNWTTVDDEGIAECDWGKQIGS